MSAVAKTSAEIWWLSRLLWIEFLFKFFFFVFSFIQSDDISMTLVDTSDSKDDVIVNKILMEEIFEYKSDDELDRT